MVQVAELSNLSKAYGNKTVLNQISYEFSSGKTYALIGPSGAGKSTLLKIIDLLEEPSQGQVLFNGVSAKNEVERLALQRKLGMVFQQPVLFSTSVLEN